MEPVIPYPGQIENVLRLCIDSPSEERAASFQWMRDTRREQVVRLPLSTFASTVFRFCSLPSGAQVSRATVARRGYLALLAWAALWALLFSCGMGAQETVAPHRRWADAAARRTRVAQFVAQRQRVGVVSGSHAAVPHTGTLAATWQPVGPAAVASVSYGKVTGRVTAVAVDANDATGNTVYVGTTGGGVWKSTNAAGPLAAVSFTTLTDTLPVFAGNAGSSVIPSLSMGAVSVQPASTGVILAGTGDPNDATDSYYGEGILRSADGGLTWTLAQGSNDGANGDHSFLGLGVAGFAWSTTTPALTVAALSVSAEGALVGAVHLDSVPGLYYSSDAGVTWQMATLYDGSSVVQQPQPLGTGQVGNAATAVVWDALRQRFYAAVRQHGFYESTDGATWTRIANQPGTGLTVAACPIGANGLGSATCPLFRGTLAVQAATGDLYALSVDSSNNDNGLWQDLCAAAGTSCSTPDATFAHRIDAGAMEVGNGSAVIVQGDYNLTLAAAPVAGGTLLFAGTVDVYRCAIGAGSSSCSLRNTTNALNGCDAPAMVAPAQHAIALVGSSPVVFVGNDGGLWRSLDGVAETGAACNATDVQHFDNLNGAIGSLAEVTGFAQHPTDPDTLLAGLGANGSAGTSTAASVWAQLAAGEGGLPSIDAAQPLNWYVATGAGVSLTQCSLGGACIAANFAGTPTIGAAQVVNDAAVLDAPTLLDPAITSNVLVGTCRVWRGPAGSGVAWSATNAISKAFGGGATPCPAASPLVRSVAAGGPVAVSSNAQNAGSSVLYAGLAGVGDGGGNIGGHLFVTASGATANSTTAWTDAALAPVTNDTGNAGVFNPFGFDISSVTVDAHDVTGATVYATVMGFGGVQAASPHVYRSVDFGTHWLNVSANLPDVPANALVVDPNDANTVYVALDTGVYVTTQIATCSTANCWSVFGTALPNAPAIALAAAVNMPTGDGRKGMLRAATYGRGIWQMPLLTATNMSQPAMTFSAPGFTFGPQAVSTQSAAQTLTITSSGNAPLSISTVTLSGDFVESDTCTGQTLAIGAMCAVQLKFAPTAIGARSGLLTVFANVAGGQMTATLNGTGTAPVAIVLTPGSLTFAATVVGQMTAAQIVTISNTGGTPSALQTPMLTGDFSLIANTCGATLPAQTGCSLAIAFKPTASGVRNGTLTVMDDAGTQTASLTGTGNAPATDTLAPLVVTFAVQQIGSSSATQQVLLTNSGDAALTLVNATVATGPFTATSDCGTSLAAHSTCAINVAFVPTAVGAASGVLTVSDQFRTQTVMLSGTGVAPAGVSLTPFAGLAFGAIGVGLTSPAQTMTLTNNGGAVLAISSIAVSGDFFLASTTCGATLVPNTACTLLIVFSPAVGGTRTGVLTLIDNAGSGTQTAALSGLGIDFTLVASGPTSVTVMSPTSATYTLLLTAPAGVSGNVVMACTGAPSHSLCTVNPSPVALGGTVDVIVTVQTGLARMDRPLFGDRGELTVLALLVPLGFFVRRRKRLAALMMVFAMLSLGGCGVGRQIPPGGLTGPVTPTPSGTYSLNVSASSAGITRSVALTLVVQ
jgi:hypothetical protein